MCDGAARSVPGHKNTSLIEEGMFVREETASSIVARGLSPLHRLPRTRSVVNRFAHEKKQNTLRQKAEGKKDWKEVDQHINLIMYINFI